MSLQSSWCFEVHSNSWLSDLKVGKATEVLGEEEESILTFIMKEVLPFSLFM